MTPQPDKFLEDLTGRYARLHFAAVHDLYVAVVTGNNPAARDARAELDRVVTETMGMAEVLGARLTLQAAARERGRLTDREAAVTLLMRGVVCAELWERGHRLLAFADEPTQTIFPRVTLTEALDDLVSRTPVTLRRAADRSAQKIAQLYGAGRVVAFARAAEKAVTEEAHRTIARLFREGLGENEAARELSRSVEAVRERSAPWAESYSRMVFRTTVNTAVTAGRFRQARDPDVREVAPAFRFDSVNDADTRPNHRAADDVILSVDDPQWARIAPPLGYNCRCRVSMVTSYELDQMGRLDARGNVVPTKVPSDAGPDEGFRHGGRPDLFAVTA
ncbi:MAG TPA: phage minor head protein [Verrucomicrobiae bacterium]|nr:phage minor head protein [Verrucomicrobiae bacterium]